MKDMPFAEAEALLSVEHTCPDMQDWWSDKNQPSLSRCSGGLVTKEGARSGLFVELLFCDPPKTHLIEFKLTVFQARIAARQRVYQLHMNKVARAPKNWHDYAHEHMGDKRIPGSTDWLSWSFKEALDYFSKRTNITFEPMLEDPSIFRLKP